MDSLRTKGRGSRGFYGREAEIRADLSRWAPFESSHPCGCGSKNWVWNKIGMVFCQRCGKRHDTPK